MCDNDILSSDTYNLPAVISMARSENHSASAATSRATTAIAARAVRLARRRGMTCALVETGAGEVGGAIGVTVSTAAMASANSRIDVKRCAGSRAMAR